MDGLFADDPVATIENQDIPTNVLEDEGLLSPVSMTELFGHEEQEQTLLKDCLAKRLPHALVFAGPSGIGKATLAYRLARFLFEGNDAQEDSLFGESAPPTSLHIHKNTPVISRMASGGHADLLVIERPFNEKTGRFKEDIPVDEVRKIPNFLRKTAAEGGMRIVIVDGAERLNRSAQNAILKILEEPPKNTLLILTTSQPGAFLPTIRSRCRFLNFSVLPENIMHDLLRRAFPEITENEITILSKLSEGSIGDAIELNNAGGVALYKQMIDILSNAPDFDMVKIYELSEKLGLAGADESYQTMMRLLISWLGRQARYQIENKTAPIIVDEEKQLLARLSTVYSASEWLALWGAVQERVQQTRFSNLDKRQSIMSIFQMLQK